MDKESNRKDYDQKKWKKEQKGDNKKESKDEDYVAFVEPITRMSGVELLKFMESKYDKLIVQKDKLFSKITGAIVNRLTDYKQ